jgi:Cu-Zn family superoxide dismutase
MGRTAAQDKLINENLRGEMQIGGCDMQFYLRSIAIASLCSLYILLVGMRIADAATAVASIYSITATGIGEALGTVTFTDGAAGLLITPKLSGLPPGPHGSHIHEKGDCGPGINEGKPAAGFAAEGHYDPAHTKKHLGPLSTGGHRGDLPVLVVDNKGDATAAVTAPHLTVVEIRGRSVMIHAGGDNYSDTPKPLGGGGSRIACGVIH